MAARDRDGRHVARCGERNRCRPRHAAWAVGRQGRFVRRAHGNQRRSRERHCGCDPRMSGRNVPFGRRAAPARYPPRTRNSKSLRPAAGRRARCAAMARSRLLGRATSARHPHPAAGCALRLCLSADGRREPASDSRGPGACRHHRAGTLPLHRLGRDGRAARTTSRLCAQGHRVTDGGCEHRRRGQARRAHLRRQHGGLQHRLCPCRRGGVRKPKRRRGLATCAL